MQDMAAYSSYRLKYSIGNKILLLLIALFTVILLGCKSEETQTNSPNNSTVENNPGDTVSSSVTLQWQAPSYNDNKSSLTDLAGFKLYYGTKTGEYTKMIDVGNSTSVNLSGFSANTAYFFVVSAYDQNGNESEFSSEIKKVF